MLKKIAIQGIQGSFHHQVAVSFFGNEAIMSPCESFPKLTDKLVSGDCTQGVMAIENSIAGAILPNYALMDQYNLNIIGEYYLPIHHNLMGLSGQRIEELTEVRSHPMALLQCRKFFRAYPHIKLVEDEDTAIVAKRIQEEHLMNVGAIASTMAAQLYDLDILAPSIQTIQNNATRFFVLDQQVPEVAEIDKASLRFTTAHKRGSLATVLNVLSDCGLNLTKIQSMPIIESPWKYAFFVDVTFDNYDNYDKAKQILRLMAAEFKVLGEYKNQQL